MEHCVCPAKLDYTVPGREIILAKQYNERVVETIKLLVSGNRPF